MTRKKTILIVGTYDTKDDELHYIAGVIRAQGGNVLTMDVSVLRDPKAPVDVTKHAVAAAGGSAIPAIIALQDENQAMQVMARGAATLAARLQRDGKVDGALILGGTMGTDLALDVCAALPLGVPKYIVSTVAFSPMIPPERLAPDTQMILWAGGLYGLNAVCKAALSQAAGAVLGAARAAEPPRFDRPLIGMTGFGSAVVNYAVTLKPALESRGFDVAVFHATGMGGRAFESLAASGTFAAVMDLAPQEVGNHLYGSSISAGPDRLTAAGLAGIPQIISTGCVDLVDYVGWHAPPAALAHFPSHAHNRILSTLALGPDERRAVARATCAKMATARGPVTYILPTQGCHVWDRPDGPLANPAAQAAFCDEMRKACPPKVRLTELDAHINDPVFAETVLKVFDDWLVDRTVMATVPQT